MRKQIEYKVKFSLLYNMLSDNLVSHAWDVLALLVKKMFVCSRIKLMEVFCSRFSPSHSHSVCFFTQSNSFLFFMWGSTTASRESRIQQRWRIKHTVYCLEGKSKNSYFEHRTDIRKVENICFGFWGWRKRGKWESSWASHFNYVIVEFSHVQPIETEERCDRIILECRFHSHPARKFHQIPIFLNEWIKIL